MSNSYYPNQGGMGGRGGGGFGRGRGGPHNHPPMGMMGPGGQMMGDLDPRMRRQGPNDPGGRGYDRGGYEYDMGPGGHAPHRGGPPPGPGERIISHPGHAGRPPIVEEGPSPRTPSKPAEGGVRYANDCEIIVTAKAHQEYAEMIEKAIKDFNLKVDIMFPKPDVKLQTFIENITTMGTIFAVVIRPDNEAHRSLSVHVLRGPPKPEEHRNMPLSAAYQLIKERYYELKRKEVGIIPPNIKHILGLLMEERTLKDKEYADVLLFLRNRRRKQNAFENRTNNVVGDGNADDTLDNPEAIQLKARILAILNGQGGLAEGERIGDLLVPRPKEPLGALSADPSAQNASFNSGKPQGSAPAGRGGGIGRGQGFNRGIEY